MKIRIFIYSLVIMGVSLMLINSCKKDTKDDPAPILAEGQFYQDGKLAYIMQHGDSGYDANVQHGLIATPYDQSTGIQWYNGSNITTGAAGIEIGTGSTNTNTIVSIQGEWLTIEGPIVKEKGSFTISGRRTYADLFLIFIK